MGEKRKKNLHKMKKIIISAYLSSKNMAYFEAFHIISSSIKLLLFLKSGGAPSMYYGPYSAAKFLTFKKVI